MPASTAELVDLLDLEQIEVGLYRGRQPAGDIAMQRVFGGQVLAQALTAATHTVPPERTVHSLHGYFLRPGRTDTPLLYDVEQVRDGGSFSSRRVLARQGGRVIFFLSASFHEVERGFEHQDLAPADVPGPAECPRLSTVMSEMTGRSVQKWEAEWGALDVRYAGDSRPGGPLASAEHPARAQVWIKADESIADSPVLHQAVLAYASDLSLLAATMVPHDTVLGHNMQAASLDHAMWFHREFRADRWLLYDQVSPSAHGGLGLSTARLFQDGRLVADVAQEGLIRPDRPQPGA